MIRTKIGNFDWVQVTDGHLKAKDKIKLATQIIVPSLMGVLKAQLRIGEGHTHAINFNDIIVPDTKIIIEAINELDEKASPALINHSWRTYFWAAALGQINGHSYDPEVLLVSALFHDIGLTDSHRTTKGDKCFTAASAMQFEKKAQAVNYDAAKSLTVKDAICMHMNGYIDTTNNPSEVVLLQQGASCDVVGDGLFKIAIDFRVQLLKKYPRENFNAVFKQLLAEESKTVKKSRTNFLTQLGLARMITINPFKE